MYLVRDVLDKEILDRDGFKGGKVDDILLDLPEGERPIVRFIVTQHGSLAALLPGPISRLNVWLRKQILDMGAETPPKFIRWEAVTRIDVTVQVGVDRREEGLLESEDAVWNRWIKWLPWAER